MLKNDKSTLVILILDPNFKGQIDPISPAWIVDSAQNKIFANKINSELITLFEIEQNETLSDACNNIISTIDEHHNEHSQTPAYNVLQIVGVYLQDVDLKEFESYGFNRFEETKQGFVAFK